MLEKEIQKSIIDYLGYRKDIYFVRNNSFAGNFLRKDGSSGWIKNSKAGSPDIILCFKGKFIGVEVKNEKGKMSELQEKAQNNIQKVGGIYLIIRSLDEFIKLLEEIKNL